MTSVSPSHGSANNWRPRRPEKSMLQQMVRTPLEDSKTTAIMAREL